MSLRPLDQQDCLRLRPIIANTLQWAPFDFLPDTEPFRQVEREEIAENWTRMLDPGDDFRGLDRDSEAAIFAERLPWDSRFFGYDIVRLNGVYAPTPSGIGIEMLQSWLTLLRERQVKYVFALVYPEELAFMRALTGVGFSLVETRQTFYQRTVDLPPPEDHPVRLATAADIDSLSKTAREMINPYDRFHADPFIAPADADRMMETWVRASIETGFADFVVVPDVHEPRAFCTVKNHRDHWDRWQLKLAQPVVLGAVDPLFKGWYRILIDASSRMLAQQGAEVLFWKTQLTNRAAIRTAEKLGYRSGRAEHVFSIVL
jgi:hypothetical protein